MTASSRDYHHICRSSLRSVPADEVDDSTFLGARQDPTPSPRQSFCNYLHSETEHLEERDFLTFRNDTVKLLSEIQYKAEERKRQVTTSQEVTTYQLPEASQSTAGREYVLTIPETQPVSIPVVQPQQTTTGQPVTVIAKVQQPSGASSSSAQPTSYVVVDDQQPGTSRQIIFKKSQHNTSGLSSLFAAVPSVLTYQQMDTPQPFSPSQLQPAPSPVPISTHHEHVQPVQPAESESAQISGLAHTRRTKHDCFNGHPNRPKTINNLHGCAQKQKKHTIQRLHLPTVPQKNCVNECVNVNQI